MEQHTYRIEFSEDLIYRDRNNQEFDMTALGVVDILTEDGKILDYMIEVNEVEYDPGCQDYYLDETSDGRIFSFLDNVKDQMLFQLSDVETWLGDLIAQEQELLEDQKGE